MAPDLASTTSKAQRIVLVRHAKAERERALGDVGRALTDVGVRQAHATATWLVASGVDQVDLALVSPAVRTDQTWRILAAQVSSTAARRVDDLYATSAQGLVALLAELPDDVASALVVGHEPVLSRAAAALAGTRSDPEVVARVAAGIRPGTAVVLSAPAAWGELVGGSCRLLAVGPS